MKKEIISDVLIRLWNSVDQAGYDMMIRKAFENCPTKLQKEFIGNLLGS